MLHQRLNQHAPGASARCLASPPSQVVRCRAHRRGASLLACSTSNGSEGASNGAASRSPTTTVQDPQATIQALQAELKALRSQMASLMDTVEALGDCDVSAPPVRRLSREDYELLPHRIVLLRHAESKGNVDRDSYSKQPDHTVPLTERGKQHARGMGQRLHEMLTEHESAEDLRVFIMCSPYCRTLETTDMILESFSDQQVVGVRQAVQLREQDFGNLQDPTRITQDLQDRQTFGRFWFRFPNGESGADVYDRLTIFEDHLTRDMLAGRFCSMSLVLVTHGLTLRLFLMRWFHWSVDEFLEVYNPPNCQPVVLEKLPWRDVQELQGKRYAHAKHCYHITPASRDLLRGVTVEMASYHNRKHIHGSCTPRMKWIEHRAVMAERGLYGISQHQAPLDSMDVRGGVPPPLPLVTGSSMSSVSCDDGGHLLSCEDVHLRRASRRVEQHQARHWEDSHVQTGGLPEACKAEEEGSDRGAEAGGSFCEEPEGWARGGSPSPPPPPSPSPVPVQPSQPSPGKYSPASRRQGAAAK